MIREIQGKIRKIRARFEDSKEIPGAVDVIPNRVEPLVKNRTRTICPRVDSISCPVGQNFLGKCVPRTHYPGGHNFLRHRDLTIP